VKGTTPGLFGGTRDNTSCDKASLVDFLEANPDKGGAWAKVHGIDPRDIRAFVDTLTPVLLEADTRVTNHGFKNGVATPKQSVLEAGTAVLVDNTGVPRARCACGNPLLPPQPARQNFVGDPWPGFDPNNVQVVAPGPPTDALIIKDVDTGRAILRPVGTDGFGDRDATSSSSSSSSSASRSSSSQAPTDVTATGFVQASSVNGGDQFPASLAVDGDVTTSWFSAGASDGPTSTFTWDLPGSGQMTIDTVKIIGNAANSTPKFRRGFGFESVNVLVVDLSGVAVFDATVDLGGTPDPDVTVRPGRIGHEVVLIFHGHESRDCGGFAELQVLGS
jgi:hypothetical protein